MCHYSGTSIGSKTLRKDVRDTKAWELLAKAQLPRKTRDAASDALARVQSHVRRRLLADAMALETPQTFRPNQIEDLRSSCASRRTLRRRVRHRVIATAIDDAPARVRRGRRREDV